MYPVEISFVRFVCMSIIFQRKLTVFWLIYILLKRLEFELPPFDPPFHPLLSKNIDGNNKFFSKY